VTLVVRFRPQRWYHLRLGITNELNRELIAMGEFDRRRFLTQSAAAGMAAAASHGCRGVGTVASASQLAETPPAELTRQWVVETSQRFYGLRLNDQDADAVTTLVNALRVESQRALAMAVEHVEPAMVFHPKTST
jgi:hypothetical protein